MINIDTADAVFHRPTRERWVVAFVRDDRLAWCGWPEGTALLADCLLVDKASDVKRLDLLQQMALAGDDSRGRYARQRLAERGQECGC